MYNKYCKLILYIVSKTSTPNDFQNRGEKK